jgi:hypothetical protein
MLFGGTEQTRLYPGWFILPPAAASELISAGATGLVETYLSPAEPAELDQEPEPRNTQRLFPTGRWQGLTLLTRNDPRQALSERALSNTWQPLLPGTQRLDFSTGTGADRVAPGMLVQHDGLEEAHVRIRSGTTDLLDTVLGRTAGRLQLPELTAGAHQWQVQAPASVRLFVSHLEPGPVSYREQSVQRLTDAGFSYPLQRDHAAPQTLTLRVFSQAPGRVRLRLAIGPWRRSSTPQPAWTYAVTEYDLALEPTEPAIAVERPQARIGFAAVAFQRLGEDLPAGATSLQLQLLESTLDARADTQGDVPLYLGLTLSSDTADDPVPVRVRRFEISSR